REMQARQIHAAIVIDEYGGTAGLVAIEDILGGNVGGMADGYDGEGPRGGRLSRDTVRRTPRPAGEELAERVGARGEGGARESVGGLLAHALGRVPIAGSTGTVAGLTLTAESIAGRRNQIGTVLVRRATPRDEDEEEEGQ